MTAPAGNAFENAKRGGGEADARADGDAILAAWTTLEVLTPHALPNPDDLKALGRTLIRWDEDPRPWSNPARRRQPPSERGLYWFVYLGQLDIAAATQSLLQEFPDENAEEYIDARGQSAIAVVVLDAQGRPILDKTVLSSFAWGYGCVRRKELRMLADFETHAPAIGSKIGSGLLECDDQGEVLPVSADRLQRVTHWLIEELGLPVAEVDLLGPIIRVPTRSESGEVPEPELLNSFFVQDLSRVRRALRNREVGSAMLKYLAQVHLPERLDILRETTLLREAVRPDRLPMARWPSRGRHPLALMQQVAVNHSVNELASNGIVGVNGPPGTGKTTLLRDIVAKIVLDRALAMAALGESGCVFEQKATLLLGKGHIRLYQLPPSLLGHEIVVASSNNKAVENISAEIPSVDALADDLDPPLRYFSSISDCLNARGKVPIQEGTTWGLAAAALGNATNKNAFANAFWWNDQRGLGPYLRSLVDGWNPQGTDRDAPPEVMLLENAPLDEFESVARWRESRSSFLAIVERVRELFGKLSAGEQALRARGEAIDEQARLFLELRAAETRIADAHAQLADIQGRFQQTEQDALVARSDRDAALKLGPGWLARFFRTSEYRAWATRNATVIQRVEECVKEAAAVRKEYEAAKAEVASAEAALRYLHKREREAVAQGAAAEAAIEVARALAGQQFADGAFWNRDSALIQQSSPWIGPEVQEARDQLFCAAFALHRAFVDAHAKYLRHNLSAAMALLKGRSLTSEQEPTRRSLWASLFLVVPVVSTTFASVSRLFGPLGQEQLGWLLIDEAGQATPQAAVGAIWRSSRVIAIGDPMQIEPVVTTPERLVSSIFNEFGLNPELWAPPKVSVQALADRVSSLGTLIRTVSSDKWVGSPLLVHRRCEEPMFSISNQIGYEGKMVYATRAQESPIGGVLGKTAWLSLESEAEGKWSEQEGQRAVELLLALLDAGIEEPDVFLLSPFRIVANRLRQKVESHPRLKQHFGARCRDWVRKRVGTVHTFQGKEAEAVILVLGAAAPSSVFARNWAGDPANLLNVAVSRAQRRLYVIGSRKAWRSAGAFQVLDRLM